MKFILKNEKNNEIHKVRVEPKIKEIEEYLTFMKFNDQLTNIHLSKFIQVDLILKMKLLICLH